jgi:hypothetical protein
MYVLEQYLCMCILVIMCMFVCDRYVIITCWSRSLTCDLPCISDFRALCVCVYILVLMSFCRILDLDLSIFLCVAHALSASAFLCSRILHMYKYMNVYIHPPRGGFCSELWYVCMSVCVCVRTSAFWMCVVICVCVVRVCSSLLRRMFPPGLGFCMYVFSCTFLCMCIEFMNTFLHVYSVRVYVVFVVSLHLACPVRVCMCMCMCCVIEGIYSPCLCVCLFFLSKNIHVLHANVCHTFYVYRSSFVLFLLYYIWILSVCWIYASLVFLECIKDYTHICIFSSFRALWTIAHLFLTYALIEYLLHARSLRETCTSYTCHVEACLSATLRERVLCARWCAYL